MSIATQAICIFALMGGALNLPRLIPAARERSEILMLLGTGALLGLVGLDLFPEMKEEGGQLGLVVMLVSFAAYSALHFLHLGAHDHGHHHPGWEPEVRSAKATLFLVLALVGHSFSNGVFLALAHDFSMQIASSVFFATMAHKAYESLALGLVLDRQESGAPRRLFLYRLAYLLSFPLGVVATAGALSLLVGRVSPESIRVGAVAISALALGSFLGCLLHDFLVPSLKRMRSRPASALWLVAGALSTFLITHA